MSTKTKVEILVAKGCASRQQTEELVAKLLVETSIEASVDTIVIEDVEQAVQARFLGSPSVHINGIDVEPAAREQQNYGFG